MIGELGEGVPLQRRPVVGVEAGVPGLGAPTAAQEQARMTRDVLDRLLATCSSDRLADICDRAVCLSAQRPDIADFTLPRHPAWAPKASVPDEAGRVLLVGASSEWLERGPALGPSTAGKRCEERALARLSINLIVKRRCALVGLDATEFAAHGLRSAITGLRRSIRCPG